MRALLVTLVILAVAIGTAGQTRRKSSTGLSNTVSRAAAYHPAILRAAAQHGVDPHVLWTIAYLETRFRPGLVSPKGARGMMQFIPGTGRRYGLFTRRDFHDPIRSIDAAARYVRDLSRMLGGRLDLVLAGYNAGENAVIRWGYRLPPYRETRSYVARGLSIFERLKRSDVFALDLENTRQRLDVVNTHTYTIYIDLPHQNDPTRAGLERSIYFSRF